MIRSRGLRSKTLLFFLARLPRRLLGCKDEDRVSAEAPNDGVQGSILTYFWVISRILRTLGVRHIAGVSGLCVRD